jgi:SAM-dependent methyltransferase
MEDQRTAPSRFDHRLAPLYGAARSLMAREGRWQAVLAEQVAPEAQDIILDVGCGAGALSILLARLQPDAAIVGFDHRPGMVAQARIRARDAGVRATFIEAEPHDAGPYAGPHPPTKVVLTFTGGSSTTAKLALMQMARQIIDPAGMLHVADVTPRPTDMMQRLLRAPIETLIGGEVRPSNAPGGDTSLLIRAAGFVAVEETSTWPTPAGAVSLFRARAS